MDVLCTDLRLNAGHGRLGKGDESLWMEAETGEAETVHRKRIARHIGPCGVCLKRRLGLLRNRWWQTLHGTCGPGRPRSEQEEKPTNQA